MPRAPHRPVRAQYQWPSDAEPASTSTPWQAAIELAGAAAGFVIAVAFVGGLVFAARLEALKLPLDAGVSLLPTSVLIVAGLRTLIPAALLALVVIGVAAGLNPAGHAASRGRRRLVVVGVAVVALVILAWVSLGREPLAPVGVFAVLAFGSVVVFAVVLTAWRARTFRQVAYGLAAALGVFAAGVEAAAEVLPPTKLDFVTVHLRSGETTDGWFLASDGKAIYVAPNIRRSSVGAITAVPRADMTAMTVVREQADVHAVGVAAPSALVGTFREPGYSDEEQQRLDELLSYAAGVRVDPGWVYPPVVPVNALDFLNANASFGAGRTVPFPAHAERVAIERLLADPQLYAGRAFNTRGTVVGTHVDVDGRRFILLATDEVPASEAFCSLVAEPDFTLRQGDVAELHATVLGWGSWSLRKGKRYSEVILECAAARRFEGHP